MLLFIVALLVVAAMMASGIFMYYNIFKKTGSSPGPSPGPSPSVLGANKQNRGGAPEKLRAQDTDEEDTDDDEEDTDDDEEGTDDDEEDTDDDEDTERKALFILESPWSKSQVERLIASKIQYTVWVDGISWNTIQIPAKNKGVTVPLQVGGLPRYYPKTYIPNPLKTPPPDVLYLFSFKELGTKKLGTETQQYYNENKLNWDKYHDHLLFNGTTETTFQEIYEAIEPRVKSEMNGEFGISKLWYSTATRGDCIIIDNNKIVRPNFKIYHAIPQEYHVGLIHWIVHPTGKPIMQLEFLYFKKPRENLGLSVRHMDRACDGFMEWSGAKRNVKWDETFNYNPLLTPPR